VLFVWVPKKECSKNVPLALQELRGGVKARGNFQGRMSLGFDM
jgi:hypothetical protein